MIPVIVIVGPTGTGKSRLAIVLAQRFDGEIINADSRQIYRYLNIGTAKPSPAEMAQVPHHLFDILNPDQEFSLAEYLMVVKKTIEEIYGRHKIPFLVGGSGQYIWALLEGWSIPAVKPDYELRKRLSEYASQYGVDYLYEMLVQKDPAAAASIDRRNIRRVIRALEVSQSSPVPFSSLKTKKEPDYHRLIIGLTADRDVLYQRVDSRVDEMIKAGLISEVEKILEMGYSLELQPLQSIGYKQIGKFLKGEISLDQAVDLIKTETHRYIRHQYAWFKLNDRRINWFNIQSDVLFEISTLVGNFLHQVLPRDGHQNNNSQKSSFVDQLVLK